MAYRRPSELVTWLHSLYREKIKDSNSFRDKNSLLRLRHCGWIVDSINVIASDILVEYISAVLIFEQWISPCECPLEICERCHAHRANPAHGDCCLYQSWHVPEIVACLLVQTTRLLVANFSVRATYLWQVYTNCSKTYSKLHNLGSTTGNQAILLATANDYCNRRRTTNHGGWSSCINNILIISDKSHVENRLGWLSYNSNWQLTIHNRIQITMVIIYHSYWGLHVLSKRATHATVNWWKW